MRYVLIYNNPERNYVIGLGFESRYGAMDKLRECVARGMLDTNFQIVPVDDPQAVWLLANKHVF